MIMMADKKKHLAALIPAEKKEPEPAIDEGHMIADELCHAVTSGDRKAVWDCLKAAFELLDSEPHEEGPHIE